jgi:2-C-methyl-D-erythritol 4-phosphate cytidylyltransferase
MRYAIIVAGGIGSRFKSKQEEVMPKQFLILAGKPVLMHTLEKFNLADNQIKIIVVLPEKNIEQWNSLCAKYNFPVPHKITTGGETRFHSVKNGLTLVEESDVVAVHDGVRPLVSVRLIKKCFE